MTNEKTDMNRREALTKLGMAAAAAVVVTAAGNNVQAQTANLTFLIATYRAYHQSAPQYSWETRIYVYNEGVSQYGQLFFMKEGQALPANTISANGLSGNIYYPISRLSEIRELLRNEKRLRLTLATNGIATISNETYEPIGDADL